MYNKLKNYFHSLLITVCVMTILYLIDKLLIHISDFLIGWICCLTYKTYSDYFNNASH